MSTGFASLGASPFSYALFGLWCVSECRSFRLHFSCDRVSSTFEGLPPSTPAAELPRRQERRSVDSDYCIVYI
ncbi:hypothetical protein C8R45DRAFT_1003732 [Mycena sanguinolenta]|nr:hypothetical protein C8R45DRAFT_1003732 [Mycena sanguinolenta]